MYSYYLIDHHYRVDEQNLQGEFGHLLAFNPGSRDAQLTLTFYFEDREPVSIQQVAKACQSSESNYSNWPIQPGTRFALRVDSTEPLICQSTVGWNVTLNNYNPDAATKSPQGLRETAKSYMAIDHLAREWFVADGIVIDMPDKIYVRESEWALLLNPGDADAEVTLALHYQDVEVCPVTVPARRLKAVYMDDIARRNSHYGVHFSSNQDVAAMWVRTVSWYDRDELMAYWSVPCVSGPFV